MEYVEKMIENERTVFGISGEKKAVEIFITIYNDLNFWKELNEYGEMSWGYSLALTNEKWDSIICNKWMGICDGDLYHYLPYHYLPFAPKYKARWDKPLLRLSDDFKSNCPIENHPFSKEEYNNEPF